MANKLDAMSSETDILSQEEHLVVIEASLKTMKDICVFLTDAKLCELRPLVGAAYAVALAEQLKRDFKAHYGVSKVLTLTMAHLDIAWNNVKQLRPSEP
ncbi:hypothetical protein Bca52824_011680 [Brassica carinata]|uniref:Uncharacterized protein n=1 Tax=Brassica carinata TaxID=52824 RepID=A0A8X7VWD2_BRACI|nr:hypothetical protein Bca52824_011680 [Brassica carinata]